MKYKNLLSPITINGMELKNRMVVPPLATNYATRQGYVTDKLIGYYAERAKGGFGLIEIEVCATCPQGRSIPNEIALWDDKYLPGLTKLAKAIHDNGAKTIVQVHHCGRASTNDTINDGIEGKDLILEAPSPIDDPCCNDKVRELTTEDVYTKIQEFIDAAVRVQKAGFDGVQLHCTHGYLLSQFLSRHANKRVDEFGGSARGRAKIVTDIIAGVREKCGEDFVIDLRLTADEHAVEGIDAHEAAVFATIFEEAGINMIHVTCMSYISTQYMSVPGHVNPGYNLENIRMVKSSVGIPVIGGGRINDPDLAEWVIANGVADLVFFGREHVCDPYLPRKIMEGRTEEISPCISCNESCLGYLGGPEVHISCLVNPMTGHEFEGIYELKEAAHKKKVAIIGAGPAGLMMAWVAAARGHTVDVYDRAQWIGGAFRLAAYPPGKQAIAKAIKFYGLMCDKYGAKIHLNTEVDEAFLKNLDVDEVYLATGAKAVFPKIPGLDKCRIATDTSSILSGEVRTGQKVLIAGGGFMGAELAEFLLEHGKDVTIVEMTDEIGADLVGAQKPFVRAALRGMHNEEQILQPRCTQLTNATIQSFTETGIVYVQNGEEKTAEGFDNIVVAMGVAAYNPLEETAKKYHKVVRVIGDADKPARANKATEAGLAAAMALGENA